jgi:hypothetical protein
MRWRSAGVVLSRSSEFGMWFPVSGVSRPPRAALDQHKIVVVAPAASPD